MTLTTNNILQMMGISAEDAAKAFAEFGKAVRNVPISWTYKPASTMKWTLRPFDGEIADPENFMVVALSSSPPSSARLVLPEALIEISSRTVETLCALNIIYPKDDPHSWAILIGFTKYVLTELGQRCKLIMQNGHYTEIWIPIEVL